MPLAMNAQNGMPKTRSLDHSTSLKMRSAYNAKPNKVASLMTSSNLVTPTNDRGDRATYTYSFSNIPTTGWSTSGGTQTINNINWTYSSSTYIGVNNSRIQIGSKNSPQTTAWTIQTPISSFGQNVTVTGVSITGYTTQTTATYAISVNGTTVKNGSLTTSSATYSATNLNYTSGNIVVTMTGSRNSRAMYLSNIQVTYEIPSCDAPTNVTVNATPSTATVSWEGESDSYNLSYRELTPKFTYDFESASPFAVDDFSPCTTYDGDGSATYTIEDLTFDNQGYTGSFIAFQNGTVSGLDAHGGNAFGACFAATTPPNNDFFILPSLAIETGDVFSFWAKEYTSNYPEAFRVGVYRANGSFSSYLAGSASTSITPTTTWTQYSYDLSAYNGQTIQLAIQCVSNDAFIFCIDDISVLSGSWSEPITNVTSPYTIEGLSDETNYEVQVQGVCSGIGESDWVGSSFSTLSYCTAPTDLDVELTDNSAELSWSGYMNNYNVQYRIPAFDGYYINEPLTPDNIGDWGTLNVEDNSGFYYTDDNQTDVCWEFYYGTNPPQYLFSPDFPRPTQHSETLTFDYKVKSANYPETFEVIYFVGDDIVEDDQVTATNTDWVQYTSNVPVGATSFVIAYLSNDQYILYLDNFVISSDDPVTEGTDWVNVTSDGNSLSLGFNGLESESLYEWQVQGQGCDEWSTSSFFTTPEIPDVLVESISADDIEDLIVGETETITPIVLPAEANPAVTYTSNDETIATVNENGVVTGVAAGNTTITIAATDGSGITATINVGVINRVVTEITADDIEDLIVGETAEISYTVIPDNATIQTVTFTSDDETVATVDATTGEVTAVGPGTATITIAATDGSGVTATINVTVISNPDAVQFTVTAPSKAVPGDIITVEAYLNAPTSGNYDGFTGLVLGIHFDTDAFEAYGNPVNGPVANACTMTMPGLPNATHPDLVQLSCVMTPGNPNTTTGLVFSMQFTVLAEAEIGSYEFYAEPLSAVNFVYNPGSAPIRIPYEATPSTVFICEKYIKSITGYGTGTGNWYLIAPPLGNVAPEDVTNMLSNSYDLYYFDQETDGYGNEWINYKGDANNNMGGFDLEIGKGYLYANSDDVDLIFYGISATESTYPVQLKRNDNARFAGWNLVGNPYTDNAYFADNRDYYTMNSAATAFVPIGAEDARHIEVAEGVFVIAEEDNEEVVFTTTAPAKTGNRLALNLSQGNNVIDRAFIRFSECRQLPKLQFNQNSTKVYIPMDDKDYAVVRAEEIGEMPVNFKAESNGTYSLNFTTDNVEFAYLHLIDNLTGNDVDLLSTPSYSFEAKTTDYESRFKLVFATGNNSNDDNFAFFSNGSFVINNEGEATLQVIDVTGRVLKNETINGCANVSVDGAAGVYMLRLINGDNMKVQKVVVK